MAKPTQRENDLRAAEARAMRLAETDHGLCMDSYEQGFCDGAAHARDTGPVRRFLTHDRSIQVRRVVTGSLYAARLMDDGSPGGERYFAGPTPEAAAKAALDWLTKEESDDGK